MNRFLTILAAAAALALASAPAAAQSAVTPNCIYDTDPPTMTQGLRNPCPTDIQGVPRAAGPTIDYFSGADSTLTRPNNTTAYAANQALGSASSTIFTWTNLLRYNGSTGMLTGARMEASVASIAATNMGNISCRVYNASPSSPPSADQQAWLSLVANSTRELGRLDFSTWVIGGTGSDVIRAFAQLNPSPFLLKGGAASRNIYSVCSANAAFTPAAQQIMQIYLSAVLF